MVRIKKAVASRKRRKRLLKKAKGFWGDRKNHVRQAADAVMKAMSYKTIHRKTRKQDFRSLWITRVGIAVKAHGISYSKFIFGLAKAKCPLNRKMLSQIAIHDPRGFSVIVDQAKRALV